MLRAIVTVVVCVAFLAGCTKVGTSSAGANAPNAWTVPGVLRVGSIAEPNSLDCAIDSKVVTADLCQLIFSFAVRFDGRGRPVPDAIETLPSQENGLVSRDGLSLTYKLRRGMKWHDGAPVTSEDFWFTWRVVMNPHNNVINTKGWRDIVSIDHRDPLVAVVHLRKRFAPYLAWFWADGGNAPILPAHLLAKLNDDRGSFNTAPYQAKPVGSGPFKVVGWQRGSEVHLVASDDFYLGKPALREIRYRTLPDQNTLLTQLQTHELDLVTYGDEDKWNGYNAIAGVRAIAKPQIAYRHIDFNLRDPLFADVRLREALAYAIDRATIVKKNLHGIGDLADADQSPVLSWAYTAQVPHHPYDPRKAAMLLEAMGWKKGPDGIRVRDGKRLSFTFSTTTEETHRRALQTVIQSQWRDAGIEAQIKNYPAALFFMNGAGGTLRGGHYQVALYDWFSITDPDHSNTYASSAMPLHGNNITFWSDPQTDTAFAAAGDTYELSKRKAAYATVQRRIAGQLPTIVLYFERVIFAYNADLKHFDPGPLQTFWNAQSLEM